MPCQQLQKFTEGQESRGQFLEKVFTPKRKAVCEPHVAEYRLSTLMDLAFLMDLIQVEDTVGEARHNQQEALDIA